MEKPSGIYLTHLLYDHTPWTKLTIHLTHPYGKDEDRVRQSEVGRARSIEPVYGGRWVTLTHAKAHVAYTSQVLRVHVAIGIRIWLGKPAYASGNVPYHVLTSFIASSLDMSSLFLHISLIHTIHRI